MQNELPEWAIAHEIWAAAQTGPEEGIEDAATRIAGIVARALLAAERRGIERAAKVAERRMALAREVTPEAAAALFVALPDAIRQLGDTT